MGYVVAKPDGNLANCDRDVANLDADLASVTLPNILVTSIKLYSDLSTGKVMWPTGTVTWPTVSFT